MKVRPKFSCSFYGLPLERIKDVLPIPNGFFALRFRLSLTIRDCCCHVYWASCIVINIKLVIYWLWALGVASFSLRLMSGYIKVELNFL